MPICDFEFCDRRLKARGDNAPAIKVVINGNVENRTYCSEACWNADITE